jgi:thioredoxin-like negative regulator of GroEL
MYKTNGKYKIALVEITAASGIRNALNVQMVPSMFLMYRGNIA